VKLATRVLLWAGAVACAGLALRTPPTSPDGHVRHGSFASRLLGPLVGIAAAVEWGRFESALRQGDEGRAWIHADRALALAPDRSGGWTYLAHHAIFERASPLRTQDPVERRRWIEVGLALLARGEREALDPGPVAFRTGIVYATLAGREDGRRALPISSAEAWRLAAEAFDRAAAAGEPIAAEAARLARESARDSGD